MDLANSFCIMLPEIEFYGFADLEENKSVNFCLKVKCGDLF